jgi:hypothetical protein
MRPRSQADENFNAKIITGVLRRESTVDFRTAASAGLLGLPDRDVLAAAAQSRRILVSHDHRTLADEFRAFVRTTESAGLLIVSQQLDIRQAIEELLLVWGASEDDEWINQLTHLPL